MTIPNSTRLASPSRPAARLLMILCGAASALAAGAAGAASLPGDLAQADVPKLAVRYSPEQLATDDGARKIYRRLVNAAEQVCPGPATGTRFLAASTQQCRAQAVASAVTKINNSRLAAVYTTAVKAGS